MRFAPGLKSVLARVWHRLDLLDLFVRIHQRNTMVGVDYFWVVGIHTIYIGIVNGGAIRNKIGSTLAARIKRSLALHK